MLKTLFFLLCFCSLYYLHAQKQHSFRASYMFSNNMVIQHGINAPIWGVAQPKSKVTIQLDRKAVVTTADSSGKWLAKLPAQKIGGPHKILLINGKDSVTFSNVMAGEVWVCSGQSNMEMPVGDWGKINNYDKEIEAANFPDIRLMHLKKSASNTPEEEPGLYDKEQWQECSPATISKFSAAAYFFAKTIYRRHKIPIGLIQATYGGTLQKRGLAKLLYKQCPTLHLQPAK